MLAERIVTEEANKKTSDSLNILTPSGEELPALYKAWKDLADNTIDPNPFFEPWSLLPAIRYLSAEKDLLFVFIRKEVPGASPILTGFFPLQKKNFYGGIRGRRLPLSTLELWRHKYCYLCTPLIRKGTEEETLQRFFTWVHHEAPPCRLLELPFTPAEGTFHHLLVDKFFSEGTLHATLDRCNRAVAKRCGSFEEYCALFLSSSLLRESRRRERHLKEQGRLDYQYFTESSDTQKLVDEFVDLEARSWKGTAGCAVRSTPEDLIYFREMMERGLVQKKIVTIGLYSNNKPIAFKCNFLAGEGSFSFKISYDPEYAKYGPGILLELENLRFLHSSPSVQWTDSCAMYNNRMFNHLYGGKRTIQNVLLGTGQGKGDFFVSLIPLAKYLRRVASGMKQRLGSINLSERS